MGIALLIALALSLDGFGVGMAYGLRKIKIPLGSILIIAGCTALAMLISMIAGELIMLRAPGFDPELLGALVLIGIGSYHLIRAVKTIRKEPEAVPAMALAGGAVLPQEKQVLNIRLDMFGLVIQVLKQPQAADLDGSGVISWKESLILGAALALDALAGGMAASLAGVTLYVIGFVACIQIMMIGVGHFTAGKLPDRWAEKGKLLPGALLIFVGLLKIH